MEDKWKTNVPKSKDEKKMKLEKSNIRAVFKWGLLGPAFPYCSMPYGRFRGGRPQGGLPAAVSPLDTSFHMGLKTISFFFSFFPVISDEVFQKRNCMAWNIDYTKLKLKDKQNTLWHFKSLQICLKCYLLQIVIINVIVRVEGISV
jgi:hypothetical protein